MGRKRTVTRYVLLLLGSSLKVFLSSFLWDTCNLSMYVWNFVQRKYRGEESCKGPTTVHLRVTYRFFTFISLFMTHNNITSSECLLNFTTDLPKTRLGSSTIPSLVNLTLFVTSFSGLQVWTLSRSTENPTTHLSGPTSSHASST